MDHLRQHTFHSNGNLILTGEYFVLEGAKALAVPLQYGQDLTVYEISNRIIHWEAMELGKPWFQAEYSLVDMKVKYSNDQEKAIHLQRLLRSVTRENPEKIDISKGYHFLSNIQFDTTWGWGSSATLIANLSAWASIDPFKLNNQISSGSGYDIAASLSTGPIIYQLEEGKAIYHDSTFDPPFHQNIFFIHLGNKQNTEKSILSTRSSIKNSVSVVNDISALTTSMECTIDMKEFSRLVKIHEEIIAGSLNIPRIKNSHFSSFDGEIKSLGAWGGDFIMAVTELPESAVRNYFTEKGLKTIFKFDQLIKR